MDKKYSDRLDPLIPYIRSTHHPQHPQNYLVRMDPHTPEHLRPMWPCQCGAEHSLYRTALTMPSMVYIRASFKETPACGPVISVREIVAYFKSKGWKPSTIRAAPIRIPGDDRFEYIAHPRVSCLAFTAARPAKPAPRLSDVRKPHKGGTVTHRRIRNMVDSEIAVLEQQLLNDYPSPWQIIKTGGTPDFLLVNASEMPWRIEWAEAKLTPDTLRVDTQEAICVAIENAGLPMHVYPVDKIRMAK